MEESTALKKVTFSLPVDLVREVREDRKSVV